MINHQYSATLTPKIKNLLPNLHRAVMLCGKNATPETVETLDRLATEIETAIEEYEAVAELDWFQIGHVTRLINVVTEQTRRAGINLYAEEKPKKASGW